MLRELGGATWRVMVDIVPVLFRLQGTTQVRILRAEPAPIIEALRDDAVFAVDTAMRLAHGAGFLAGGDVQVYLTSAEPLERREQISSRCSRGPSGREKSSRPELGSLRAADAPRSSRRTACAWSRPTRAGT